MNILFIKCAKDICLQRLGVYVNIPTHTVLPGLSRQGQDSAMSTCQSLSKMQKKTSHLNQKKCKAQKNVSRFIHRYGEYTGDLLTVAGAQELQIYVSFFNVVLNIQSVRAGGGESYHNLKIFFKLKVSCEM